MNVDFVKDFCLLLRLKQIGDNKAKNELFIFDRDLFIRIFSSFLFCYNEVSEVDH